MRSTIQSKLRMLGTVLSVASISLGISEPAKAEPAIWVAKKGHATVYLFGTFHLLKKDLVWETPKIKAAFDKSQELWLEVAKPDDVSDAKPLMLKYGIDKEHPLSAKLSAADNALLAKDAASLGATAAAFEPLRPWMAALQLSLAPLMKAGYDAAGGADLTLRRQAVARHEPVSGFETVEEQLRFFADLPQKSEVEYLHRSLADFDHTLADNEQAATYWENGDIDKIDQLLLAKMRRESPELYDILLKGRNQRIAEQIRDRMIKGGVIFVGVGAAHLAGPDSIQADLKRMGVKAERI